MLGAADLTCVLVGVSVGLHEPVRKSWTVVWCEGLWCSAWLERRQCLEGSVLDGCWIYTEECCVKTLFCGSRE